MKSLGIILTTAAVLLLFLSPAGVFKTCRSHDQFMFLCRHNDTNTDIYLRRIAAQLDKVFDQVFDQVDKRPEGDKTYYRIEEETYRSRMIVSCTLEQLRLLKKGNIRLGFLGTKVIPVFLLHYDNRDFDRYTDVIVCSLTEFYNYTKEEAASLRSILLDRSNSLNIIKYCGLENIKYNLYNVIRYEVMQAIIEESNFINPENLWTLINQKMTNPKDPNKKTIMKTISDGEVDDMDALKALIRKVYFGKNIEATKDA